MLKLLLICLVLALLGCEGEKSDDCDPGVAYDGYCWLLIDGAIQSCTSLGDGWNKHELPDGCSSAYCLNDNSPCSVGSPPDTYSKCMEMDTDSEPVLDIETPIRCRHKTEAQNDFYHHPL